MAALLRSHVANATAPRDSALAGTLSWAVRGPLGTGVRGSGDFGEGENRRRGSDSRWYEVTGIHLITRASNSLYLEVVVGSDRSFIIEE